jgi:hypothetical protein
MHKTITEDSESRVVTVGDVRVSGWIDDSERCSKFHLEIQQTRPHLNKPANSI